MVFVQRQQWQQTKSFSGYFIRCGIEGFFKKNPWLSTGETNKQITHCMEPSLECSICFVRGPPLLLCFAGTQPNPNPFTPKEDDDHHRHHRTDRHQGYYISRYIYIYIVDVKDHLKKDDVQLKFFCKILTS